MVAALGAALVAGLFLSLRPPLVLAQDAGQDFGFDRFCREWREKLRQREQSNRSSVAWKPVGGEIEGRYLGYGEITDCRVKLSSSRAPVGILSYEELTYRLAGGSREEAERSAAEVVSRTEVTEIFRYSRGRWQY